LTKLPLSDCRQGRTVDVQDHHLTAAVVTTTTTILLMKRSRHDWRTTVRITQNVSPAHRVAPHPARVTDGTLVTRGIRRTDRQLYSFVNECLRPSDFLHMRRLPVLALTLCIDRLNQTARPDNVRACPVSARSPSDRPARARRAQ